MYRYGFNGKENDNEVKGQGNKLNFDGRVYDPRLGRWFSTDPQEGLFPDWSTYSYSYNNPINYVDPNGESPLSVIVKQAAKVGIKKTVAHYVRKEIKDRMAAYMSKGWAKQLLKDAEDAMEVLDTEW